MPDAPSVFDLDLAELKRLARWRPGEVVTAEKLNEPVDRHNELAGGVRPPMQLGRITPSVGAGAAGGGTKRLRFKSHGGDDYLTCVEWDGTTEGNTVYVAKPYTMRASITSRAGVTYTYSNPALRLAAKAGDSEWQVINPSYEEVDELWAIVAETGVVGPAEEALTWLDQDTDGRAWAKQDSA